MLPALPLLALIFVLLRTRTAAADPDVPWPRCGERLDGQQLCSAGSVCECRYNGGGQLSGQPAGWRWSCDILRMCGETPVGPPPPDLPPGFTYAPGQSSTVPMSPSGPLRPPPNRHPDLPTIEITPDKP